MKKTKLILTMAAMAGMVVFSGCNAQITIGDTGSVGNFEAQTIVIETNMEEVSETQTIIAETFTDANTAMNVQDEFVADVFTEADENWNYVLMEDEEFAYQFEVKYDEATYQEYATITCQGDKGTYWTYETGKYEVGQCCRVELLESPINCIYLNEGGMITALNLYDGNVLWRNSDYQGSGSVCTMDENDNLYVGGFDSPALFVVDANGNTLLRVVEFADYFWPSDMSIEDNMLTICFDSEDNAKVVMDIQDYSYTIQ